MTWHADELLGPATPAILAAVRADTRLASYAHVVPVTTISRLRARADRPNGLLIVRPVCDAAGNEPAFDWYRGTALDSQSFTGSADMSVLHAAHTAHVGDDAPTPPRNFLAAIQDLALRVGEPLVYYSCAMWGGDIELEQAFVLGSEPHVYSKLGNAEAVCLPSAAPSQEDVLVSALRELGFELTDPYFEPHTRAFEWQRYTLPPA